MINDFKSQQENLVRCNYLLTCKVDHFKIEKQEIATSFTNLHKFYITY